MNRKMIENIKKNMEEKTTEELQQIWQKNDRNEYSDDAFDAIYEILKKRKKIPTPQQCYSFIEGGNMWECKKCGKENVDNYEYCSNCGSGADGSVPSNFHELTKINESNGYVSSYGTSRIISQIVSFLGWVVIVISVIAFLVVLIKTGNSRGGIRLLALLPFLYGFVSGLLLVMYGQFTRATLETADNTGEMLFLMKKQKQTITF